MNGHKGESSNYDSELIAYSYDSPNTNLESMIKRCKRRRNSGVSTSLTGVVTEGLIYSAYGSNIALCFSLVPIFLFFYGGSLFYQGVKCLRYCRGRVL